MRGARLVRVAWLLAGLTLTLEVADTLMTASYRALFSEETIAVHGWPFNTFAVIGSSFMGALIVSRYPRHPVGWLLSAVGTGASISLTLEAYSIWVLDHDGPGSQRVGQVTGWLSLFSGGAYRVDPADGHDADRARTASCCHDAGAGRRQSASAATRAS